MTAFRAAAFQGWTAKADEELLRCVEKRALSSKTRLLGQSKLAFKASEEDRWAVAGRRGHEAYARFLVLRALNQMVKDVVLPCVAYSALMQAPHGRLLASAKRLLFSEVRGGKVKAAGPSAGEAYALRINRSRASDLTEAQACDMKGEAMQFAQASASSMTLDQLRRSGENWRDQPFFVSYVNEEGVDQGGIFRSFFADVAEELMSAQLPVFVASANQITNSGEHRECYVLNPGLCCEVGSPGHRLLRFLGRLMGVCLLRGDVLPLSISQVFWKSIVGDELGLEDLEAFDIAAARTVEVFRDPQACGIDEADFDAHFSEQRFVFEDSAHRPRHLMAGGDARRVTVASAPRFAELALELRLKESAEQLDVVREGLAEVVAEESWCLWSWRTLEEQVVGVSQVDVALLKRKARLDSSWAPDAPAIRHFWAALQTFEQEDLRRFLHFVWGRSRLPPEESHLWGHGFKVNRHGGRRDGLPQAHTCFFQIDLPDYDSEEVARDRILFAVRNCVTHQIA